MRVSTHTNYSSTESSVMAVSILCALHSDGMSRTGVFITVMSEIDRVKVEGEMDIFHTVKAARTARPYMVSTVVSLYMRSPLW